MSRRDGSRYHTARALALECCGKARSNVVTTRMGDRFVRVFARRLWTSFPEVHILSRLKNPSDERTNRVPVCILKRTNQQKLHLHFKDPVIHVSYHSLSKITIQGTLEGGRRHGGQMKYWMDNVKEWLPMPEKLAMASLRQEWQRISAGSTRSLKGLN